MKACVDIGGTKVAVSLAQGRELAWRRTEPTAKDGRLAVQVLRMIDQACADAGAPAVTEVGVSSCGPFVLRAGMTELAAPNICPGSSVPLEAPLRERFAQVRIENDAVAALEAERRWGALQGIDHCAYVTWSTGIGVGLCVDGRVLRGRNGNAGHAGHTWVSDGPSALCGCGNAGDVESLVSGSAIARRFAAGPALLFEAAQEGDVSAAADVDRLCDVMGRLLHNLVVALDLQAIALGGSVFWHQQRWLLPGLRERLESGGPAVLTRGVQLVPAGLGLEVGDYAALALVA
ncbi:MAG: ROK family protein [Ramlibacter sp.]